MGIEDNLIRVFENISFDVKLVVVTKNRNCNEINSAILSGAKDIGESYVDEALKKFPHLIGGVKKHFIGPIQSNKIKKIVSNFDLIQSLSRVKEAKLINKFSKEVGKIMPVLIQINISQEESKSGILVEDLEKFLVKVSLFENIRILGFMSIGSVGNSREFREMKKLFNFYKKRFGLVYLSMGMSGDYKEAVLDGANMIRVGKGIFEE